MGSKLCCCRRYTDNNSDTEFTAIPLQQIDDNEPYNFNRNVQRNQHIRGDVIDFHRPAK